MIEAPKKRPRAKAACLSMVCWHDKQAPAVYLALCEISAEKKRPRFRTSRKSISRKCGIPDKRISRILSVLHEACWIKRRRLRHGLKTYLFIKVLKRIH